MTSHVFGSDRVLLYDVDPWNKLGFGCPNFGNNHGTLNHAVWGLADQIGRMQLGIMTNVDAQRSQYPSVNTVVRIGKMYNRIRAVFAGRMKTADQARLEEGHATANAMPWNIHPVPFFVPGLVRNHFLAEYNRLTMFALTNLYQHSDNNLALTVTAEMAMHVMQYFAEIKRLVAIELLGLPRAQVDTPEFTFTDDLYANYANITNQIPHIEALASPGPIDQRLTEDDLKPLYDGIPSTIIYPLLKAYPVGDNGLGDVDQPLPNASAAPGTADGSAIGSTPAQLGQPMI